MNRDQVLKLLLTTGFGLLTIFGLFAIRYTDAKRFSFSKAYLTYSLCFTLSFIVIYTHQMYTDYVTNKLNLRDAAKLYGYMNAVVAITNYLAQFLRTKKAIRFLNAVPLYETVNYFDMDITRVRRAVYLAIMRACVFPLVIETTLILQQWHNDPERGLLWTLYILFPIVVSNLLNNCYFGAMLMAKQILSALNMKLQMLAQQANSLQSPLQLKLQKQFYRMQRFCEMADTLDELSIKYSLVCCETNDYMELMSLSLVCSLLCNLLGITVGFFNQYHAIANTFINEEPYDVFTALTNLVFLFISFFEVTWLAYLCNSMLLESQDTGYLLQTITLQYADIRFKQALHMFSLQVSTIKYKIMPLGLLEINVSLVNDVLSAVMSFLLILIQSDLTLRFSLK